MAPDVLLAADPTGLPGQAVDAGMSAHFAAANTAAWQLSRWILECSRAKAGTTDRVRSRRRAGKIVAASLGWSEGYASHRIEFARQVLERLPRLGEAMRSGRLEEHKANDIVDLVADLDDHQAREVVDKVLDAAPTLAFTALRQRVGREAAAVDPDWYERRRAAAIARRRVTLRSAPSGAAELSGRDLPEDPAQDAHHRIVALAHAVRRRLVGAGVIGVSVGEIESEVMLTLTGPVGAGMYDLDVVEHVTAVLTHPDDDPDGPHDPGPDLDGPDLDGPDDNGPYDSGPDDTPDDGDDDGPTDSFDDEPVDEPDAGPDDTTGSGDAPVVAFRPRTVLRLELRTVLGLDRRPGEIPGLGPVMNSAAVAMAWARAHCRFRINLYDDHGHLDHVLSVRPPATGPPPIGGRRRHQIVELTAHTRELDHLAAAGNPEHAGMSGAALELLRRAVRALARGRARPDDEHPAHTRAEAHKRLPSTRLRDWVTARDRTCRAPGCSVDATGCDADHTLAVTDGGQTAADDLGPLCRSDHRFKHDPDTGWSVTQTSPGRFAWTSPTGRVHVLEPEPYRPLSDPVPRTGPTPALDDYEPRRRPPGEPRANKHGIVTWASLETASHLRRRAATLADQTDEPPF